MLNLFVIGFYEYMNVSHGSVCRFPSMGKSFNILILYNMIIWNYNCTIQFYHNGTDIVSSKRWINRLPYVNNVTIVSIYLNYSNCTFMMFGMMTPKKTSRYDSGNFQYHGGNFVNHITAMNCTSIRKIISDSVCVTLHIFNLMEGDLCSTYATIYR